MYVGLDICSFIFFSIILKPETHSKSNSSVIPSFPQNL